MRAMRIWRMGFLCGTKMRIRIRIKMRIGNALGEMQGR
jgi:hypothetical protein